jgi:glycerophosphoryl diester phosphodiesterase
MIFVRKIKVHDPDFKIIAHKGGGRNIDRQPFPENSISLIEYCERLGANSIEIDVQLTKDKVPVLFHDEYLSKRTINEDYFIGKLSDYTFNQLRDFVTLRNLGDSKKEELIPTLDEALSAVSKNTGLRTVWLDIKDPDLISYIFPILNKYYQKGTLDIYIGIPDEDVFYSLKQIPDYQSIPTLCELDENYVIDVGSLIWAPRWSLGLINDRVGEMHSKGKDVFVWTLDDPVLVKTYFHDGNFDGIVTNFSPVVAYEYYMGK